MLARLPLLLTLALAACSTGPHAGAPPSASSSEPLAPRAEVIEPVTLVESVPVETTLGFEEVPDTAPTWVAMIAGATKRIDMAQFYVSPKPGGRLGPVLTALEEAAGRGVKVRLLADAMFAERYPEALERIAAFGEVQRWDVKRSFGGVQHAKYFVVDDQDAYLGSANWDWRALEHIHELGVRIRVPALAKHLRVLIDRDWARATGRATLPTDAAWSPVTFGADRYHLAASPLQGLADPRSHDLDQLVAAIDGAALRVVVQLLGYDTRFRDGRDFFTLDRALRRAASRGVAVRLVVAHWQKRHPEAVQALAAVPGIEVRFATIPEHSSGFIPFARTTHAKYMAVDGHWGWVGTSNWDGDYFFHSRNVGLIGEGPTLASALERVFTQVWASPYCSAVDPDATYEAPKVGP